ncbi:biliverdin-producing heme oxygenase [Streptomyces sp. ISL-94]|uniref:biliverdin-producing heme oxygenase n=1 Tax=Streptomyces sp. ISL-94 TaxID=2819190 RepID=UPI001BEA77B8|nr:biliverdin-producing heme oxygenase [Streptomyces sp. ISL-94]MBT2479846.1 biliverdin-producing heme oxygenase [Streptomyces sp. ISL-94]
MSATVVERLRSGTRAWHDGLESTRFATAMTAGTLPLDRYVGQLTAYGVVLEALEDELSRATSPSVGSVWSADLGKLPLVERDLAYFAGAGGAPVPWAAAEAGAFAREIRRAAASDPRALLGFLYVMEGSTLGGLVLRPYVAAAYGLHTGDGVAYYGSGDRARWARFTARMNGALTEPGAQDRVIAAARRACRHTAAIARALSAGLPPGP